MHQQGSERRPSAEALERAADELRSAGFSVETMQRQLLRRPFGRTGSAASLRAVSQDGGRIIAMSERPLDTEQGACPEWAIGAIVDMARARSWQASPAETLVERVVADIRAWISDPGASRLSATPEEIASQSRPDGPTLVEALRGER